MNHISLTAATLQPLLKQHGISVPCEALAQACAAEQTEAPPLQRLGRILQRVGQREVQAALLSFRRFDRQRLPALLLHGERWWLAESSNEGRVRLSDGLGQHLELSESELDNAPVLWLQAKRRREPGSTSQSLRSPAARLLLGELLRGKRWLVDILVATLVINVLAVATSLFAMQVYDRVVPTFAYATLAALVSGMLLILLLDVALKLLRARVLEGVAKTVDRNTSQKLFEHLLHLRLDARPQSVGSLAAQVSGLESARGFFSSGMIFTLTDLPFALLFVALIGLIGGPLGWLYLGLLALALLLGGLAQWRLRALAKAELQRGSERHGLLVDSIQGAESIQASASAWRFATQWRELSATIADYATRGKLITSTSTTLAGALGSLAYVLAIVVGVGQIEAGALTVGGLIACTILGGRIIAPASQAVQMLAQWQQVREALQMVDQLLVVETERAPDQALLLPERLEQGLSLDALRFAYPNSPVLQVQLDSLVLKPGERVVLLGGIGSGKSTLLKLAAGLYRPGEGRVRLGSADLWQLDPQLVAERVGYLPQDVHLFKGSLRSNLALAGGSDARLLEISQQLGLDRLAADHPRGLERPIGEGGQGLSGGQRQLVGLARVMLAQPKIWLLDEPTAALDGETEKQVMNALHNQLGADDILLIATHKPQLLALANRVLVMRGGRIVADGPPQEVLASARVQNKEASHG